MEDRRDKEGYLQGCDNSDFLAYYITRRGTLRNRFEGFSCLGIKVYGLCTVQVGDFRVSVKSFRAAKRIDAKDKYSV